MPDYALRALRILVVEDEYLLADDLDNALKAAGAVVLGPVPSVAEAMLLLNDGGKIDAAVLDMNLQGELVSPVADILTDRGVPFVFATGYDQSVVHERFAAVTRCEKPVDPSDLVRVLKAKTQASDDG